ncbi:MAG: uncharacterized protein A8A55_2156, partial [Amphiamblys sp. WSBS2006]
MTGQRADEVMVNSKNTVDEMEQVDGGLRGAVSTYRRNQISSTSPNTKKGVAVGFEEKQTLNEVVVGDDSPGGLETLADAERSSSSLYEGQQAKMESIARFLKEKVQEAVDSMCDTGTNRGDEVVLEYEKRLDQIEREYEQDMARNNEDAVKERNRVEKLGRKQKEKMEKRMLKKVEQVERIVSSMGITHMDNKDIDERIKRQREGLNAARERFQAELYSP